LFLASVFCKLVQRVSSRGRLVFKDATVALFPNVPDNETREKLPETVENCVLVRIVNPIFKSMSYVSMSPSDFLQSIVALSHMLLEKGNCQGDGLWIPHCCSKENISKVQKILF
jgi:hypothetical protein